MIVIYTMQAVKFILPVYFLAKFDISDKGLLTMQWLRNRGSCVTKR